MAALKTVSLKNGLSPLPYSWSLAVMEYGTYLFVLLMFAGRFSTLREIGLYLPAAIWLIRALKDRTWGFDHKEPLFLGLFILFLSAAASSFLNNAPVDSLNFIKKSSLKLILLYCVISAAFADRGKMKNMSLFLALAGIVYELSAFATMGKDLITAGEIDYPAIRNYATVLLFFLPFMIHQYLYGDGKKKALWLIALIGSLAGIILTGVRGSLLSILGVLAVWAFFVRKKSPVKIPVMKIAAPVLVIIVAVFLIFPSQYEQIRAHAFQKVQMTVRFEAWSIFIGMAKGRPFLGHGLDDKAMSEHYRETYKSRHGSYPDWWKPVTPHNQYLKILYQQGIAGLGAYLLLVSILIYRTGRKLLAEDLTLESAVPVAVLAAVAGEYVIRILTEDRSLIPLGFLAGMAGAFLNIKTESKEGLNDDNLSCT